MRDDAELLREYSEQGSEPALAELVHRYVGVLYTAAVRQLGSTHRADDVVQSVFIDLARKASSLTDRPVLAGWLFSATFYACSKVAREDERRSRRERDAFTMLEHNDSGAADEVWQKIRPCLDAALSDLNEKDRSAVLLRFFTGQSYSAIGYALSVTEDAARKRVDRALVRLRERLARRGVASTAAALAVALSAQPVSAMPPGLATQIAAAAFASGSTVVPATSLAAKFSSLFMTTKTMAAVAALFAVFATGIAVNQTRSACKSSSELAAATQRLDDAYAQIAALKSQVTTAASNSAGANSGAGQTQTGANGSTSSPSSVSSDARASLSASAPAQSTPPPTVDDVVMTDPEFQELHLKEFAAGLPVTYAALYRKLKLTPDQRAQFESIMVDQRRSILDAGAAAKNQGLSVANPGLSTVDQEIVKATSEKLFALLGKSGTDELNRFDTTAESKVVELAGRLYSGGIPLTTDQGDALNRILTANTTKEKRQGLTGDGDKLNQGTTLTQAEKILLPEQFSLFRSMLMTDSYRQQANDRALHLLRTQGQPGNR